MKTTIELTPEEFDELSEVWHGGIMPDVDDVIDDAIKESTLHLSRLMHKRRELAISGAMRWPWSQEAVILSNYRLKIA
jgi:hypothetical protein